jgi:hypothetical protein
MELGEYISQLDAPSSSGIPRATPEDFGGDAARGLGILAKEAMDYDQVFRAQADELQRVQDVSALTLDTHKRVTDLNAALEEKPDWQTHEGNWLKGFGKIKQETLDGINDPVVKKSVTSQLADIEASGYLHARQRQRQLFVDSSKANLTNVVTGAMEGAAKVDDPSALIGLGIGTIRSAVTGGIISAEEGAKSENDFLEGVQVGFAKRDILNNPAIYYQKKQAGAYAGIGIGKVDLLDQAAIRQMEHNERVAEHQVKKSQEKNDAVFLAGIDAGAVTGAQLDDAFLGPTRDPNFTPIISPAGYKEGRLKVAARSREGGPRNPAIVNTYKMEINLNPGRYSDKEITSLGEKGLNPADVLDILEYKRARVDDLQKLPPGAATGMEIIRTAVPRGFMNTMTDKIRVKLIADEQEYISRVKKTPEKWFEIASDISNRWKTVRNPQGTGTEDLKKLLNEAGK